MFLVFCPSLSVHIEGKGRNGEWKPLSSYASAYIVYKNQYFECNECSKNVINWNKTLFYSLSININKWIW